MQIPQLREAIDSLDAQILKLLDQRFGLALEVARAKRSKGLPLLDAEREAEMLAAARAQAGEFLRPDEAAGFLAGILDHSRRMVDLRGRAERVQPRRIAIIGLGLIGGSLAMALKRAQPGHRITGVDLPDRAAAPREAGLFESVVDAASGADGVRNAEFAFICTPLDVTLKLLPQLADDLPKGCVVTDVAGLKAEIAEAADVAFAAPDAAFFVGGHPMAGKAASGFEHASPDLFEGRPWILTPRPHDPADRLNELRQLIESTGAVLHLLLPKDHDRTMALVSHLPQLLATSLMLTVAGRDRGVAGPALLDMTRLAASSAAIWNDLCRRIDTDLIGEIQRLRAYLTELEIAVTFAEPLDKWFSRANTLRVDLEQRQHGK